MIFFDVLSLFVRSVQPEKTHFAVVQLEFDLVDQSIHRLKGGQSVTVESDRHFELADLSWTTRIQTATIWSGRRLELWIWKRAAKGKHWFAFCGWHGSPGNAFTVSFSFVQFP